MNKMSKIIASVVLFVIAMQLMVSVHNIANASNPKYHNEVQQAIIKGNYPPSVTEIIDYPLGDYEINEEGCFDLTDQNKYILSTVINQYPQTKKLVRKEEGLVLVFYSDRKKEAIGYGDNHFKDNYPQAQCITKDVAEWLMHWHLENKVIKPFKATTFYKKWGKKVGNSYLANTYSKIYNVGFQAYIKSKTYKLSLKNPFDMEKVEQEWIKWDNEKRRRKEIQGIKNDVYFQKASQQYKSEVIENVLDELTKSN